jgi:hypothetical protein
MLHSGRATAEHGALAPDLRGTVFEERVAASDDQGEDDENFKSLRISHDALPSFQRPTAISVYG